MILALKNYQFQVDLKKSFGVLYSINDIQKPPFKLYKKCLHQQKVNINPKIMFFQFFLKNT